MATRLSKASINWTICSESTAKAGLSRGWLATAVVGAVGLAIADHVIGACSWHPFRM